MALVLFVLLIIQLLLAMAGLLRLAETGENFWTEPGVGEPPDAAFNRFMPLDWCRGVVFVGYWWW